MLKQDDVKTVGETENTIQIIDLVKKFFKRTSTSYKIIPKREVIRQNRLRLFKTESDNEAHVSPDRKWIMVQPEIEGRIKVKE